MFNYFCGALYGSATTLTLLGMYYVTHYGLPDNLAGQIGQLLAL